MDKDTAIFHIALHFLIPLLVAGVFYRQQWLTAWLIMCATIIVDVDHVLANPIYDPLRCSINFHPLHTFIPIIFYGVLTLIPKVRLIGLGLIIHMALDSADCFKNQGIWFTPPGF